MGQSQIKTSVLSAVAAITLLGCTSADEACGPVSGDINSCTSIGTGAGSDTDTSGENSFAFDFTSASYNANGAGDADDTLTLVGGDFDGSNLYVRDAANDRGGMLAFTNDFQSQGVIYYATYGESSSGDMVVYLNATGDYVPEGDYIAAYDKLVSNSVPSTGNANYSGGYSGAILNTAGGGITLVEGDLDLFVEFDENGKVTGFITNRSVTQADPFGFDPEVAETIVLNEANLESGGGFSDGTTTAFNAGAESIGSGTYKGTVGGPGGSEAVGALDVTIGDTRELGVFVGDCVPGPGLTCDAP